MQFVFDPPIHQKIKRMQERVRWRHSLCTQYNIDQTQLAIDDGGADDAKFSFLVVGDSGAGFHRGDNPQKRVADSMMEQCDNCRFVLHTGDVIYLVGSSEQYFENFILPYQNFLAHDSPERIQYDDMVFQKPILPVPGNHDYYNLPLIWGVLSQITWPIRSLLQNQFDLDVGLHGSNVGDAYARAFLDYLKEVDETQLEKHLQHHYSHPTSQGMCLKYQPGVFTRLPNRYYRFRYGGIDFFALDSNTFNEPQPISQDSSGASLRAQLEQQRAKLQQERLSLLSSVPKAATSQAESDQYDDVYAKAEQIDEQIRDINKQLNATSRSNFDTAQLDWLKTQLIASWNDTEARGRIIYFHHPPYVTEATKWDQGQTLAIRYHLRRVFDAVSTAIAPLPNNRPIVDLVLSGHAHCLEHLRTHETGHADAHLNWIVCGGSGFSLRRQRAEGPTLTEHSSSQEQAIAESLLFVGRNGHGSKKKRPYSYLRIDVEPGTPPKISVSPFVVERFKKQWRNYQLDPIVL